MTSLAKPHPCERHLLKFVAKLLSPPPLMNVWQWAESRRRLGKDVTARPGRYRIATAPFQREPQESFTDRNVQVTVLCWAKRLGKTEMTLNLQGSRIELDPCNMLVTYPIVESAEKWSKQFFVPMVNSTPALKRLIRDPRTKGADNTIRSKRFPGGTISVIGAKSPTAFRQVQAPVVICDEIDDMEPTAEGDPVLLAFGRAENYPDSVQVLASTPTFKGESRIWHWLEKSDFRKWFVPCLKCGTYQVLMWDQVRFTDTKPEEAKYECENCKALLTDEDRIAMILAGEWRPTQPFRGIRGYWLNGLNSTFPSKKGFTTKLHQFVADYLDAKDAGEVGMITQVNTFRAETYERQYETTPIESLMKRREVYNATVPAGVFMLTAGADVHPDRIECSVWGWGDGEEQWLIMHRVFTGSTSEEWVWTEFREFIQGEFQHERGVSMRISCTFIDSGFNTNEVYKFTRKLERYSIFACKGSADRFSPMCNSVAARNNSLRAARFDVGTHAAKNQLFYRLRVDKPGPRYVHFPINDGTGCDFNYFEQLTAQRLVVKRIQGQVVKVWEIPEGEDFQGVRDETLDCAVYASAGLFQMRPNWHYLKRKLSEQVDHGKKVTVEPKPDQHDINRAGETSNGQPTVKYTSRRRDSRSIKDGSWRVKV